MVCLKWQLEIPPLLALSRNKHFHTIKHLVGQCYLTHFSTMLPLYRNQYIDLQCKPVDWFQYTGNTELKWINNKPLPIYGKFSQSFFFLILSQKTCEMYCHWVHLMDGDVDPFFSRIIVSYFLVATEDFCLSK